MPSDTRTEPRKPKFELSLSTLVVSVFLVLGLIIAGILVASGYHIARQAIEADIDRHRDRAQQIATLIVTARLHDVRQLLDLTVQESALRRAMANGNRQEVEAQLTGVYFAQEEGVVDVLFAHLFDADTIIDAGRQTHTAESLRRVVRDNRAFSMTDQVAALDMQTGREFFVLSSNAVLDPQTGRVLGSVYAGKSLSENVSLLSAISRASGASAAVLEVDGTMTAPYVAPDRPDDEAAHVLTGDGAGVVSKFRSDLPISYPPGRPVVLISSHPLFAVQELGRSYRVVIVVIVATTIVLAIIGAWILRQVTRRASASISAYVAEVNRHDNRARFRGTAVSEFNEVGQTLSRFVTALRDSEARAQIILNNAPVWITIKSVDGVYSFVNRAFESTTGLAAPDVVGKRTVDVFPPVTAARIDQNDGTVVELRSSAQFEASIDVKGEYCAFLVTKFPLLDAHGGVSGICSIGSDITQLKLSERALTEALAVAESASQAKSRFLATMSHEFRTPLNAILGFSDLIRQEYLGPAGNDTYVDYAGDIHRSGQQMLELVDEILDSAAIEAGQRQFDHKPVNLYAVIEDAIRQFQPAVGTKGLRLDTDVAGGIPEILSDDRAIFQVLQNLLSNAVKFTPRGGQITLRAGPEESRDDRSDHGPGVMLQVSDTGVGMAPEVVENVTDPFFQDRTDPHLAEAGTGLGLSIVKSIVDGLGGRMEIESEMGKGTTITVHLPPDGTPTGEPAEA